MSGQDSHNASSSSQDPAVYLQSATFSQPNGAYVAPNEAVTASDLLHGAFDPAKLHPLADLSDKLDYLVLDDEKTNDLPGAGTAIPSRGWSDDLCYGTGTMYLSGQYPLLALHLIIIIPHLAAFFLFSDLSPYLALIVLSPVTR
jgi:mitochondrial import inner membrane translocase subunit TIM23